MGTRAVQIEALLNGLVDKSGEMLSAGLVYTYEAGTSTVKTCWSDSGKTTEASNPIVLDAYGRAQIYGDGLYKLVVKDSDETTLYTWDNVKLQANTFSVVAKIADYEVDPDDDLVLVDCTSGAVTISFATVSEYSHPVTVQKTDSGTNAITVNPYSTETVDGEATITIDEQYCSIVFYPGSATWTTNRGYATLAATATEADHATTADSATNADTVDSIHASATATANKLLACNGDAKLPGSITGDADTVDSIHASATATANKLLACDADAKLPASITGDAATLNGKSSAALLPPYYNQISGSVPASEEIAAGATLVLQKIYFDLPAGHILKLKRLRTSIRGDAAAYLHFTISTTSYNSYTATQLDADIELDTTLIDVAGAGTLLSLGVKNDDSVAKTVSKGSGWWVYLVSEEEP
jgi:hypothetical protein